MLHLKSSYSQLSRNCRNLIISIGLILHPIIANSQPQCPTASNMTVTPAVSSMYAGQEIDFNVSFPPYIPTSVTWDTDYGNYLEVNAATGKVKALQPSGGPTSFYVQSTATSSQCVGTTGVKKSIVITVTPKILVDGIVITPVSADMQVGDIKQFSATVSPSDASDKTITWGTNNPNYLSIDQNGLATLNEAPPIGTQLTIYAEDSDGNNRVTVPINVLVTPVESITLNPTAISLLKSQQTTIGYTIAPVNATYKTLNWNSSNTSVATVNNGTITAIKEGTTTITATSVNGEAIATATATITANPPIAITGTVIEPDTLFFDQIGQTVQINATFLPANCASCQEREVEWYSTNSSVASVNELGVVTIKARGLTIVYAKPPEMELPYAPNPLLNSPIDCILILVDADPQTQFIGDIRLKTTPDCNNLDIIFGNTDNEYARIWTPTTGARELFLGRSINEPDISIDSWGRVSIPEMEGPINLTGEGHLTMNGRLTVGGIKAYNSSMLFASSEGQSLGNIHYYDAGLAYFGFKNKMQFQPIDDWNGTPLLLQKDGSAIINATIGSLNGDLIPTDGHKLLVNGTIKCEGLEVESDVIVSDFVFEDDYNLRPLHEVESYVRQHKHLPEIPAAEEFHSGYRIDEMDDLLLRKVEELTLYIIELEKQMKAMREEINR